jgi:hypothetical protein
MHRMLAFSSNADARLLTRVIAKIGSLAVIGVPFIFCAAIVGTVLLLNQQTCFAGVGTAESSLTCDGLFQLFVALVLALVQLIVAVVQSPPAASASAFDQLFAMYDNDYSGVISEDEIRQLLGVTHVEARNLVKQFDQDGDKEIDFDEFKEMAASIVAGGKVKLPQLAAADSGVRAVIKSPNAFKLLMSKLIRSYIVGTFALLPVLALIGGAKLGSMWVLAQFLSIGTLNIGVFGVVWMMVLYFDQLLELSLLSLAGALPYLLSWLLLPLYMALPDYRSGVWLGLLAISVLNIHGLLLRGAQLRVGAKSGSNSLKYASLVMFGVFAALGGMFVVTALQVLFTTRADIPDAFEVRNAVNASYFELHTVVGGVSIANAKIHTGAVVRRGNSRLSLCSTGVLGVSLQEATVLTQMAYLGCGGQQLETVRARVFPELKLLSDCAAKKKHGQATFLHFQTPDGVNIVSIRGELMYFFLSVVRLRTFF